MKIAIDRFILNDGAKKKPHTVGLLKAPKGAWEELPTAVSA